MVRISPGRHRIIYGETVLRRDLGSKRCHERLLFFSQRRTRHRSSILFFIGVATTDQQQLEALLARLDIRSGIRGGHVHVVPIRPLQPIRRRPAARSRASAPNARGTVAPTVSTRRR
jgi:predicted nucleic acid-binding Zn ribbon protein